MKRKLIEGETPLLRILKKHFNQDDSNLVLASAVLEMSYFVDPKIVEATNCLPIIRSRRMKGDEKKNSMVDGDFVSDNFTPHYVFCAAIKEKRDIGSTQLCHIYSKKGESGNPFFYTNLANLCLMPAFLAKFSDTNNFVINLLQQCSYVLYNFNPYGQSFSNLLPDLQRKIQLATSPKNSLAEILNKKKDQRFLQAKKAGFLFTTDGKVSNKNQWVKQMSNLFNQQKAK